LQRLYAGRLVPPAVIVEVEERRKLPPPERVAREGELILDALPAGARLVALDERGRVWPSREFAEQLRGWRDRGPAEIVFAIGGADGLSPAVLDRAVAVLSLGAMTWPHFLARGMLLEQLYRAQQILAGHPYHRD
jgi:23S rRNA (pseudouridine1915-N3)-methyltransferase